MSMPCYHCELCNIHRLMKAWNTSFSVALLRRNAERYKGFNVQIAAQLDPLQIFKLFRNTLAVSFFMEIITLMSQAFGPQEVI